MIDVAVTVTDPRYRLLSLKRHAECYLSFPMSCIETDGHTPQVPILPSQSAQPQYGRWHLLSVTATLLMLGVLSGLPNRAGAAEPLYVEAQLGVAQVSHTELDFYPRFASLTLGAWVLPNIGLELFADRGVQEDKELAFELSIEEARGAALRFQSPPDNGTSGYVVLGYVDFTVRQEEFVVRGEREVEADFSGPRVSIGIVQRLKRIPSLLVSAEYRHYYVENDIRFDGLAVGLRWNLP